MVLSLPRSRSAWLAHWLGIVSGAPVGHDTAIRAESVDEWLETVTWRLRGSCETGAAEAWPVLRRAVPGCRVAVVLRPMAEVVASLRAHGVEPPVEDLERRAAALADLSGEEGVLTVGFDALRDPRTCARVQEHCLGTPLDWTTWELVERVNVQVRMGERLALLAGRVAPIARLRAELAGRVAFPVPFVTVREERWSDVGDVIEAMGAVHHAEATAGGDGRYRLNREVIAEMDGMGWWRVIVARVNDAVAGYCCWTREINLEAEAPATMLHGPFYVSPEHARHGLGTRMLATSRDLFRAQGIGVLKLHHTMHGRGVRAGRLYSRMGAVECQREYTWGIA